MDTLLELFDAKMAQLRDEFHAEQQQIIEDFTLERTTLLNRHQRLTQELRYVGLFYLYIRSLFLYISSLLRTTLLNRHQRLRRAGAQICQ